MGTIPTVHFISMEFFNIGIVPAPPYLYLLVKRCVQRINSLVPEITENVHFLFSCFVS